MPATGECASSPIGSGFSPDSLDNSSDRFDGTFVNSYDLKHNYASSNFDQRQVLNISYVYDLPFFRHPGFKHTVLGGWELSGIISHQTGTPFSVIPQSFGDAAGVANGVGGGAYVDIIGDPDAIPPGQKQAPGTLGPLLFNPAAFAPPRGLTFGNEGRNRLNRPGYSNFDMALFKKFAVTEHSHVEIRAEAFNVFNHTEFSNVNTTINNTNFLRPSGVYEARLMEFALKFIF